MKSLVRTILAASFLLFSSNAFSQQAGFDKQQVIDEAAKQLTTLSAEAGELNVFCQENSIKGEFVVDITLQGKGKVLTVFMVSSNVENVKIQNQLKSKLTEIQFENIKIPKNERVKFRQTLIF